MRRSTASAGATLLLVLAGGCGGETATDPAGSPTGSPTDTGTGASAPWTCPPEAPDTGEPEYGATGRPSLPEAATAQVCRYPVAAPSPTPSPPPEPPEPVRLEGEEATELMTALGRAEPAPEEQMCTQELGPTYLVVLPSDSDEVWVRVEAYGCTAMRIRDADGVWGPLWNAPRRAVGLLGR